MNRSLRSLRWEIVNEPLTADETRAMEFIARWKVRHGVLPDYSQVAFGLSWRMDHVAVVCGGLVAKERITVRLGKDSVTIKTLRVRGPNFYGGEPAKVMA